MERIASALLKGGLYEKVTITPVTHLAVPFIFTKSALHVTHWNSFK